MSESFIITGATGFVGSALAAYALSEGKMVYALSRDDKNGQRTRKCIQVAAKGMGIRINSKNIGVLPFGEDGIIEAINFVPDRSQVSFWHCAAEMTYNYKKMKKSIEFNVSNTLNFLQLSHSLGIKRFYYFSTAFTSNKTGPIEEEIHLQNAPENAYQASKWMAETMLNYRAKELGQPLTILRPGVIIGHSKTGWSSGKAFGFFMFLKAMENLYKQGVKEVMLNIDPENEAQLITIDQTIEWSLKVHKHDQKKFEIIHLINKDRSLCKMKDVAALYSKYSGVKLSFGPPKSVSDHMFEKYVKMNKEFAGREWEFSEKGLDDFGVKNRKILTEHMDLSMMHFISAPNQTIIKKVPRIYTRILNNKSIPKNEVLLDLVSKLGKLVR